MEVDPTFAPGPFPERLMFMLQKESNQNPPVVSFCSNGCTFKVHNKDQFLAEIMPKYFKQTKFTSFQRQLSLYNVSIGEVEVTLNIITQHLSHSSTPFFSNIVPARPRWASHGVIPPCPLSPGSALPMQTNSSRDGSKASRGRSLNDGRNWFICGTIWEYRRTRVARDDVCGPIRELTQSLGECNCLLGCDDSK